MTPGNILFFHGKEDSKYDLAITAAATDPDGIPYRDRGVDRLQDGCISWANFVHAPAPAGAFAVCDGADGDTIRQRTDCQPVLTNG